MASADYPLHKECQVYRTCRGGYLRLALLRFVSIHNNEWWVGLWAESQQRLNSHTDQLIQV